MTLRVDHPGLVPGALLGDAATGGRRTARDGVVDALAVVLSFVLGLVLLGSMATGPQGDWVVADAVAGSVCCVALLWRRRWPVQVALVLVGVATLSATSGVAALVATFTVAVHRPLGRALALGVVNVVSALGFWLLYPEEDSLGVTAVVIGALVFGVIAWGALVRARRQLVSSLRERAERAEDAQRLRADQARASERSRIAREMHDVVAHRVSLVALHAGALQVRPDLPAGQVRDTAELIRRSAQDALDELRAVVGVLRQGGDGAEGLEVPQPALVDIARLVEDSVRAGAHVDLELDVADADRAPAALGRDAFRIVQEGLTNAHKHAAGTRTRVSVRGGPGHGLRVSVRNRLPRSPGGPVLRGSGAGLLGLSERVALSGGELSHGRTADGDFVVEADLRWPA